MTANMQVIFVQSCKAGFVRCCLKGYAYVSLSDGETLALSLDENPYFVYASSKILALTGKTCLCKGHIVYCF